MSAEFTRITEGKNKAGTAFKILRRNGDRFSVWKLCANYCGNTHGGIAKAWRYVVLDVSEAEAREVFARKLKGRQK